MIATTMFILTATAGMLALVVITHARAQPRLAFAAATFGQRSPKMHNLFKCDNGITHEDRRQAPLLFRLSGGAERIEPIRAPSWRGFLNIPLRTDHVYSEMKDDGEAEGIGVRGRDKVRERVYADCVDSFEACRDRARALALKVDLLSRYPGHRSTIRRAFKEAYPS